MNNELLDILQEECAELIQAASKVKRYGVDSYNPITNINNKDNIIREIGDVLCMIELVMEDMIITPEELVIAKENKLEKLKKWSTLFNSSINNE